MLTFPAVCRLSKASVRLAMAGISCNGSHGRGTTRWNPESGSRNRVWKSHNDDSKWLSHYFIIFQHKIVTSNIISPFQFFVGNYTLSHSWGYGYFLKWGSSKNIIYKPSKFWIATLNGDCKPNLGEHSRSSNGPNGLKDGWPWSIPPSNGTPTVWMMAS